MSSTAVSAEQEGDYIVHGMMCSYFTKKLEAYFLVKGIPYQVVESDSPDFVQCGDKVGVAQLPQVQCPDGSWLTDTTPIIEHFESDTQLIALRPENPVARFCSYFLEDCFDEWLWAPAMYYRWAFKMDAERRSEEFCYTILANGLKLPRWLYKPLITWRQKAVHLKGNGIHTAAHAHCIEELYLDILDLLQPIFSKRPYLFGERPCEADFGLFGPMFPHFGNDPTPQEIMHVRAPHVARWLGRLWSTRPQEVAAAPELQAVPADLKPIMQKMAREYLPYLVANQKAFLAGAKTTTYTLHSLEWEVTTAPYRVYCLSQLQQRYQTLSAEDQQLVSGLLGHESTTILSQPVNCPAQMQNVSAAQPVQKTSKGTVGRQWEIEDNFFDNISKRRLRGKSSGSVPEKKGIGTGWLPIYFKRYRAR
ncbi:MAG: glutathione S-transferase family protein [Halioglobus sp.]